MAPYKLGPPTKPLIDPDDDAARFAELANSLQRWPARNVVARQALDRAAGELMTLAKQAGKIPEDIAG